MNSNPSCPITQYWVQRETPVGSGTFTDFTTTASGDVYVGTDNYAYAVTLLPNAPYDYTDLWVTAKTKADKSRARYRIEVKVCGAENFVDLAGQNIFVYQRYSGTKSIDLTLYRTTDDAECPVAS